MKDTKTDCITCDAIDMFHRGTLLITNGLCKLLFITNLTLIYHSFKKKISQQSVHTRAHNAGSKSQATQQLIRPSNGLLLFFLTAKKKLLVERL